MSRGSRPRAIALTLATGYVAYLCFTGREAALLPISLIVVAALTVIGWRLQAPAGSFAAAREAIDAGSPVAEDPVERVEFPPADAAAAEPAAAADLPSSDGPSPALSWLALALVVLLAAAIRLHALERVPGGFFCDEASVGYNAYSILRTGRDEHGEWLPLYFRAFGEYKNPVYIYAATASIAALGLDERSTRLPAALFGLSTVVVAFLLGRRLHGTTAGVVASALLAVSPWHVHFSRIAFELIALPFVFGLGLWVCLEAFASGRRRHYALAGLAFAASLYTYAVAWLFVPLFLGGLAFLYRGSWRAHPRGARAALLAFLAGATPLALYITNDPGRAAARWRQISGLSGERTLADNLTQAGLNYTAHFSHQFLFERGDPLKRHAVHGFGELYRALRPWLAAGVVVLLARRRRQDLLLLWWLALFPLAASLTRETPSATRSIAAIPVFELIAAAGFVAVVRLLRERVGASWRPAMTAAVGLALAVPLALEFRGFLAAYFRDYPAYSARGLDGFQHGYGEVIRFMEQRRAEYELLMLTATDANQPETLALFFSRRDPREYQRTRDTGFRVSAPEEYGRYPAEARILYALRPEDLRYFLDLETRLTVTAPDGVTSFLVSEVRTRRPLILDWLLLGPLPRGAFEAGAGIVDPRHPETVPPGAMGERWQVYRPQFANLDLNRRFAEGLPGGNPEDACAYLWTRVHASRPTRARLDLSGSPDAVTVYWNGAQVSRVESLRPSAPETLPIVLEPGRNDLLLLSCETVGDWNLQVGVRGEDGRPVAGLRFEAPPVPEP